MQAWARKKQGYQVTSSQCFQGGTQETHRIPLSNKRYLEAASNHGTQPVCISGLLVRMKTIAFFF